MTLLAVDPVRLKLDPRGYEWCPRVELPLVCQAPRCSDTWFLEKHHIVRRSETGGPTDFVTIDGVVIQNVCVLCRVCHLQITGGLGGHKARIWYLTGDGWAWLTTWSSGPVVVTSKLGVEWRLDGLLKGGWGGEGEMRGVWASEADVAQQAAGEETDQVLGGGADW